MFKADVARALHARGWGDAPHLEHGWVQATREQLGRAVAAAEEAKAEFLVQDAGTAAPRSVTYEMQASEGVIRSCNPTS